jgi:hypothetical protein
VTKRESWTRETDPPLTRDERIATEWFRALPPNEQIRSIRALKWNADVWKKDLDQAKKTIREQREEILILRAKLAVFTPAGYTMPGAASLLLAHAEDHGWRTARAWHVHEPRTDGYQDENEYARLEIALTNGWWTFQLSWSVDPEILGGHGRMIRRGLARELKGGWHDAPSLLKIKSIITESIKEEDKGS